MNQENLKRLRIFLREEDTPEIVIPIPEVSARQKFYSLDTERDVVLQNGEKIRVYAEISLLRTIPDVSLSILEGDKCVDVRCGEGVVVGYQTNGGLYALFQIGSGGWEE
jgi:hypothetical protein